MSKLKNSNETFLVIFKHCVLPRGFLKVCSERPESIYLQQRFLESLFWNLLSQMTQWQIATIICSVINTSAMLVSDKHSCKWSPYSQKDRQKKIILLTFPDMKLFLGLKIPHKSQFWRRKSKNLKTFFSAFPTLYTVFEIHPKCLIWVFHQFMSN